MQSTKSIPKFFSDIFVMGDICQPAPCLRDITMARLDNIKQHLQSFSCHIYHIHLTRYNSYNCRVSTQDVYKRQVCVCV